LAGESTPGPRRAARPGRLQALRDTPGRRPGGRESPTRLLMLGRPRCTPDVTVAFHASLVNRRRPFRRKRVEPAERQVVDLPPSTPASTASRGNEGPRVAAGAGPPLSDPVMISTTTRSSTDGKNLRAEGAATTERGCPGGTGGSTDGPSLLTGCSSNTPETFDPAELRAEPTYLAVRKLKDLRRVGAGCLHEFAGRGRRRPWDENPEPRRPGAYRAGRLPPSDPGWTRVVMLEHPGWRGGSTGERRSCWPGARGPGSGNRSPGDYDHLLVGCSLQWAHLAVREIPTIWRRASGSAWVTRTREAWARRIAGGRFDLGALAGVRGVLSREMARSWPRCGTGAEGPGAFGGSPRPLHTSYGGGGGRLRGRTWDDAGLPVTARRFRQQGWPAPAAHRSWPGLVAGGCGVLGAVRSPTGIASGGLCASNGRGEGGAGRGAALR